jgi:DNA-binding transcriptional regulator YdaS (Cro superfamily)
MDNDIEALKRACDILGSQAAAGRVCGVTPQAISETIRNGVLGVPAHWCQPLDRATAAKGERVSCHQLNPAIYPKNFVPPPAAKVKAAVRG